MSIGLFFFFFSHLVSSLVWQRHVSLVWWHCDQISREMTSSEKSFSCSFPFFPRNPKNSLSPCINSMEGSHRGQSRGRHHPYGQYEERRGGHHKPYPRQLSNDDIPYDGPPHGTWRGGRTRGRGGAPRGRGRGRGRGGAGEWGGSPPPTGEGEYYDGPLHYGGGGGGGFYEDDAYREPDYRGKSCAREYIINSLFGHTVVLFFASSTWVESHPTRSMHALNGKNGQRESSHSTTSRLWKSNFSRFRMFVDS